MEKPRIMNCRAEQKALPIFSIWFSLNKRCEGTRDTFLPSSLIRSRGSKQILEGIPVNFKQWTKWYIWNESYIELRIWNQVKLWSSRLWTQSVYQLRREAWKIQDFTFITARIIASLVLNSRKVSHWCLPPSSLLSKALRIVLRLVFTTSVWKKV